MSPPPTSADETAPAVGNSRQIATLGFRFNQYQDAVCFIKDRSDWMQLDLRQLRGGIVESCLCMACLENGSKSHRCVVCRETATMTCKKCCVAQYCSQRCAMRDRDNHSCLVCGQLSSKWFLLDRRPSERHRRAFLFHPDGIGRSGFRWVRLKENGFESDDPSLVKYGKKLGNPCVPFIYLIAGPERWKLVKGRWDHSGRRPSLGEADHWVMLLQLGGEAEGFSSSNRAIAKAGRRFPLMLHNWFGPLLAVACMVSNEGLPMLEGKISLDDIWSP